MNQDVLQQPFYKLSYYTLAHSDPSFIHQHIVDAFTAQTADENTKPIAIQGFHYYDDRRNIHIIGAGTFGAPAKEQVTGIPLQYNLLTFDPRTGE